MASPSKRFVREVVEGIGAMLAGGGFLERKSGIFTLELTSDVLGWVGLNGATGRGDGKLWINPMVGVRHQRVEGEWSRLAKEKPHAYLPPTLVANVGYLGPRHQYQEWSFAEGRAPAAAITALGRAVLTSGMKLMRETTSLAAMRRHAKAMMVPEYLLFRLPIMLALDGEATRARSTLERDLERTKTRDDAAVVEYRTFAARYLKELGRRG
jgi:hypothetical protein